MGDDLDVTQPSIWLRFSTNPSRKGVTTGRSRKVGRRTQVEVTFGPGDTSFCDLDLLESVSATPDPIREIEGGNFGSDADLRHAITIEKIRGQLTNVFYSMETSNTEFYPHQFKPVLKFIESPVGRLLLADEVGLGKTIEAGFIWKELQARERAHRLLIVCPAVLREKWRDDLAVRFAIQADLLSASDLVKVLRTRVPRGAPRNFAYICSLEGLRTPSGYEDESVKNAKAELGRLLDGSAIDTQGALFDLVVLDEAHEIRTGGTAGNRLGNLLRDATEHFLLLTATPIQMRSDNLYQLLKLVSPEDFYSLDIFNEIIEANAPVNRALRLLWGQPPDIEGAAELVSQALESTYFKANSVLLRVRDELRRSDPLGRDNRIKIGRSLENASLLGHYMSRSRKRDVLTDHAERRAQTLKVRFSDLERRIYEYVTNHIRERTVGAKGVSLFAEIARQRQMASSMVAAFESWRSGGFLDEVLSEGLGLTSSRLNLEESESGGVLNEDWPFDDGVVNLAALEADDSKYENLLGFLRKELKKDVREKFVVFAFFRGTLTYLQRRLERDGINTTLIMGGMGDDKWAAIKNFEKPDGPNVLLSSEVGSQGIDLQFCRILVNYDLPWNPMRVEQRIGRLDRLGQKAESITIVNLVLDDTIEERILARLYDRIELFENSIGNLEEILGAMTMQLIEELFDPQLTENERLKKADEIADTVVKKREMQDQLEEEAVNLVAFSDYVLDSINDSRDMGRWLRPNEVRRFIVDFLHNQYQGTSVKLNTRIDGAIDLELSRQARIDLDVFLQKKPEIGRTSLLRAGGDPVTCVFDPRRADDLSARVELIDTTHPLVQWIDDVRSKDETDTYATSAIILQSENTTFPKGLFAYAVHRWDFEGARTDRRLVYRAARIGDNAKSFGAAESEKLVSDAVLHGENWINAVNRIDEWQEFVDAVGVCDEKASGDYGDAKRDFEAENENRCDVQLESAERFALRRTNHMMERLAEFERRGNPSVITRTKNAIDKEKHNLEVKRAQIEIKRASSGVDRLVSLGAILVQ